MNDHGMVSPFGFRLYTGDDWVVRIEYDDGTVLRKGVDGAVDEDRALQCAVRSGRLIDIPKSVEIRRRRDWSKTIG